MAIKKSLEEDESNWRPCVSCKKLVGYTNDEDICLRCTDSSEKEQVIELKATKSRLKWFSEELKKDNCKRLTLHKGYPHSTAQAFSLALNYCHLKELEAKTDTDLWRAKIQLAKLKAV